MTSIELFFEGSYDEVNQQIKIRRALRYSSNPIDLDEHIFVENFRLSKHAFMDVLNDIDDKLKPIKSQLSIPNILKLAAVLKFFAQGSYQLSVGNDFNIGMAQPTVSVILSELLMVLEAHVCPKWITFQYSQEEERKAKIYFFEKCGIPNVVGAVDGTHVKIIGPKKDLRHIYYNRKGYYSINAMLICDHVMNIRYINAKHTGASHDSNVWNMSQVKMKLENDYRNGKTDFRILGDGGYPHSPYLITPYRDAEENSLQATFNKKHAQGLNIIERVIGILKSRFRCLLQARQLHYNAKRATQIINVCAAFHNICIKYRLVNPDIYNEENNNIPESSDVSPDPANPTFNEGSRIRDYIASFMRNT